MRLVLILSVLLFSIEGCSDRKKKDTVVELITVEEMDSLLSLEKVQLMDVRTAEEFAEGHLKGAINIDYRDSDFKEKLAAIDKTKPVAVYCKKGGSSSACCKDMEKAGFVKIYDLQGGITQWIFNGNEIKK